MTDSLKISDKGRQLIAIALFFLALPLRMIVMSITVEGIADGPTRALQAYLWAKSPSIITSGSWLPGYTYVTGIFSFIRVSKKILGCQREFLILLLAH